MARIHVWQPYLTPQSSFLSRGMALIGRLLRTGPRLMLMAPNVCWQTQLASYGLHYQKWCDHLLELKRDKSTLKGTLHLHRWIDLLLPVSFSHPRGSVACVGIDMGALRSILTHGIFWGVSNFFYEKEDRPRRPFACSKKRPSYRIFLCTRIYHELVMLAKHMVHCTVLHLVVPTYNSYLLLRNCNDPIS